MPRKKSALKGGLPAVRIRDNSRLMHTHESMVDYISGRVCVGSVIDVLAPTFFGFNYSRNLEDDLIYSDDDDDEYEDIDDYDDDDDEDEPLKPHPQIKQLTDEEAEKLAIGFNEEKEQRKDKTEKNKRKKMRKKEKKRQEKENAAKDNLLKEEQAKPESIEIHQDDTVIKSNAKANESPEDGKAQKAPEVTGGDDCSTEDRKALKINKKEDKEQEGSDLQNSPAFTAESVPKETCNKKPKKEAKKKTKVVEFQLPKEKKKKEQPVNQVNVLDFGVTKMVEEKQDLRETELARRGKYFANLAYQFAARGDFEEAVAYFTDAIKCNPKELKLFGNRSLCYERMRQYENALQDAEVALSMDPTWIKGLFRKGKALCGLKRYYEATLIYKEVLKLDSRSLDAAQELKRAQTLHLMEMGFSWPQSSEALKTHGTLEDAVESLFDACTKATQDGGAARVQEEALEEEEDGWVVLQTSRPRAQQIRGLDASLESRSNSQSPTHRFRNPVKRELFPVWVENVSPVTTYAELHELFSRVGTVVGIKMFLEDNSALVNFLRKDERERAIQCLNGMVVDDFTLTVRYPQRLDGAYKKECFFWRTTGCTRSDCTFKHLPEHKNIDREKMTYGLGDAGLQK